MEKIIEEINAKTDLAKITITSMPNVPGAASELFSLLGEAGFNIETISQFSCAKNFCDISFTIREKETDEVVEYLRSNVIFSDKELKSSIRASDILIDKNIALITILGKRIATTPGFAGKIFSTVAKLGVNIEAISASLMMITFLVPKHRADEIVNTIKQEVE
jgi:aspartate kinase